MCAVATGHVFAAYSPRDGSHTNRLWAAGSRLRPAAGPHRL